MIKDPKFSAKKDGEKVYISDYGYKLTELILSRFNKDVNNYGGKFYVLLLPLANPFGWRSENPEVTSKQAINNRKKCIDQFQVKGNERH